MNDNQNTAEKMWTITIYQLPIENDLCFRNAEFWERKGLSPQKEDYDEVYSFDLPASKAEGKETAQLLDEVYTVFNIDHPADYKSRSVSVGDIITISHNGETSAHFVDSFGFKEIKDFFSEKESKTMPKEKNNANREF